MRFLYDENDEGTLFSQGIKDLKVFIRKYMYISLGPPISLVKLSFFVAARGSVTYWPEGRGGACPLENDILRAPK